ncbi:hypothetical protein [Lentibacillus amyloliquefaciens]|nr:hypothetical protein [Lentibacillus amyloliquefaciens]
MPAKLTFKTSEEYTRKLMFDYFKKTSMPRILKRKSEKKSS